MNDKPWATDTPAKGHHALLHLDKADVIPLPGRPILKCIKTAERHTAPVDYDTDLYQNCIVLIEVLSATVAPQCERSDEALIQCQEHLREQEARPP